MIIISFLFVGSIGNGQAKAALLQRGKAADVGRGRDYGQVTGTEYIFADGFQLGIAVNLFVVDAPHCLVTDLAAIGTEGFPDTVIVRWNNPVERHLEQ